MISVKSLEFRMASTIRSGLRQAMRNADPSDIPVSLHHAGDHLTDTLYAPLYAQILKTYSEGYVSAGNLIHRHAPRGTLLTAAAPVPLEDPRIAKATKDVVLGLKHSLNNHKNQIQATMRDGFEKGESIPKLAKRVERYFDTNRAASTRFARTVTNDVYNRAHLDRYEDSGVVDGVQFSAHIDDRTSEICQMLNGTIWALGDKAMQVPPMHFGCRSRHIPYFGKIPGKRDFKAQFGSEFVGKAENVSKTFRSKYWSPMPHSKASATLQRSYFTKSDIKTIDKGLTLVIQEERKVSDVLPVFTFQRLKSALRYRKTDPNKSIIADRFGKSLMLDKLEERDIIRSIKALMAQADGRIAREGMKRKKLIDTAWKDVLDTRKGIKKMETDVLYYQKLAKKYPERSIEYHKFIAQDKKLIAARQGQETRQIENWNKLIDAKPSAATTGLEAEKERYQHLLDGFNFIER